MTFRFDEFALDPAKFELTKAQDVVHLEPQNMRILLFLIERRDKLVTKADLIETIWSGRIVSDWAISAAIKAVRVALEDTNNPRRYIKTIHGKGYRFVGQVDDAENTSPRSLPRPQQSGSTYLLVLPLSDFSQNQENQFLADGLTEDLIADLGRLSELKTAPRNASFRLAAERLEPADLRERHGFSHLLDGSIRREGDRIRINLELIETAHGSKIWSDRLDGTMTDIFDFQDEMCRDIARSLKIQFSLLSKRKSTRSKEAYEHCLKGRAEYFQYKPPNLARALGHFEAATEVDPEYAEAYAYQAYCRTSNYVFAWPGSDPDLQRALALANHAIEIDPSSAVAHTRLGWTLGFLGDLEPAAEAFERAIELEPENAEAWHSYGETLNRLAQPNRALSRLETAFSLDSFVPPSWDFARGHSRTLLGEFDAALSHILPVLERVPGFIPARVQLTRTYAEMGALNKARETAQSIKKFAPKYNYQNALRMFPYPDPKEAERYQAALNAAEFPQD